MTPLLELRDPTSPPESALACALLEAPEAQPLDLTFVPPGYFDSDVDCIGLEDIVVGCQAI